MGEALGLRERKKRRTRATLVRAAVDLCNRQGFERTTVDQIAAIADVSPRTFSRYFATKDAVVLAVIDDIVENVELALVRQPAHINVLEALYRAHIEAFNSTKTAAPNGLTAEQLLAAARIVNSSPALRHAAAQFRMDSVNAALAERMGVAPDDSRLKLMTAVWAAIIMTSLDGLGPHTDWERMTVDGIVSRLEATYAQFIDSIADVRQPV